MTIQWIAVAGFLYFEIFIAALFMIPFISASRWNKIFKSSLMTKINNYSVIYFNILMLVLAVLFMDAIREVFKYNKMEGGLAHGHHHESENTVLMKLFRAQRNLYVSGFALFMWFVLRRIARLLCQTAQLQAINEATLKQAQSASDAAKKLMNMNTEKSHGLDKDTEKLRDQLDSTVEKLEKSEKEIKRLEVDIATLRKQSTNSNSAYDALLSEHDKLQKQISQLEQRTESKKDD